MIAGLAAIGFAALGAAQDVWVQQAPFPTDRSLTGVHGFSGNRVIVAGQNRHLLETQNLGATWITHSAAEYGFDPYYAVRFKDSLVGIVTGNNNDALRTVNGGQTWSSLPSVESGSWYHIDFVGGNQAIIGANGACMASADNGATWSLRGFYPACPVMYGMDFRDANVGLAGGWQPSSQLSGIWRTIDGGRNWTLVFDQSTNAPLWWDQNRAIAIVGTRIMQSTDAGITWIQIADGITTGFMNMARAGTSNVVCGVSGKGDVWRSADGGFSWQQTFDGPGALPVEWNIHFADAQNGWIVGDIGFIFATHDGGQTWTQVNNGAGTQITDIQLYDADYALAVGHNGYILRTENGGAFWDATKLEVTGQIWGREENLIAVDIVDRQFAVTAGPGGMVFKTLDGGDNWINIGFPRLPGTLYLYDVDFIDHNLGYIYGIDQDIPHTKFLYRTRDGGATWEWIDMGFRGGGSTIQFVDAQYGWISADNDFGQRTINGGQTWIDFRMPSYFSGPEVSKVRFLNRTHGWVVGWNGYVAKTTNGGANWSLVNLGTIDDHLFDVVPISEQEVWICGREDWSRNGLIYRTVDGGQSWTRQVVTGGSFYYPYRLWALPTGEVSFAGYAGRIYRRQLQPQFVNPASFTFQPGTHLAGALGTLFSSDDQRLTGRMSIDGDFMEPLVLTLTTTTTVSSPRVLQFVAETRASQTGLLQTVQLWNYAQSRWETVNSGGATRTDQTVTATAAGDLRRFVQTGTGQMRARITFAPWLDDTASIWTVDVDRAVWRLTP